MTMEHINVLIVGAGLSGIGSAVHLRQRCPDQTFAILEGRARLGGAQAAAGAGCAVRGLAGVDQLLRGGELAGALLEQPGPLGHLQRLARKVYAIL